MGPGIAEQEVLPEFIHAAKARWASEQKIYKARRDRKKHRKFVKQQARLNNVGR